MRRGKRRRNLKLVGELDRPGPAPDVVPVRDESDKSDHLELRRTNLRKPSNKRQPELPDDKKNRDRPIQPDLLQTV